MNPRAALANLAWLIASVPAHQRFRRALRDPGAAQVRWLRMHLTRNANTAYGRTHGCAEIRTYEDFAARLPIAGYADLEPWITRVKRGEARVLTHDPVSRLVPTSGSSGARKLIPFTATLQREFNAAIGPWMIDLCATTPSIALGSAYWSVTPINADAQERESVVPIGFDDDSSYLGGTRAWLVEAAMAVPSSTRRIADLSRFRRAVLLHLLRRPDLRLISVWHPSFLSLLLDTLVSDWDVLLAQLSSERPGRETALRAANPNRLNTIWPRLRLVSCWADAHAKGPAAELQRRLPGVTVQPKGLLATEGCITLPFAGHHPVAVESHFFEFIDEAGAVHPLQDLRLGNTYEVIVTTGGGLWRYRMGDQVEVTGFVERTPTMRFLGRSGNVSDRCGEKLAETFVVAVLRTLCPKARFAMLAPESAGDVWRYALYLEGDNAAQSQVSSVQLDAALSANPHYALCRRLGQLSAPLVVRVSDNAYSRFTNAEMSRGMRLGDIKPVALSQRTDWGTQLPREPAEVSRSVV